MSLPFEETNTPPQITDLDTYISNIDKEEKALIDHIAIRKMEPVNYKVTTLDAVKINFTKLLQQLDELVTSYDDATIKSGICTRNLDDHINNKTHSLNKIHNMNVDVNGILINNQKNISTIRNELRATYNDITAFMTNLN